jgi:AbrB family looped-hinge helix DNA binding protein
MIVGERGQITIPKRLRDKYGLRAKTEVELVEERGQLILRLKKQAPEVSGLDRWVGSLDGQPDDVDAFIEDIRGR